jgi:hypothetical protein
MSGKIDQVTLVANPFLEVMADVTIAHLLLGAAIVADEQRSRDDDEPNQTEIDFYSGKVMAAKHFVNFILPTVHAKVGASNRKRMNVCTSCIKAGKVTRG